MTPLPPGATIGILGGGQLGRMLAVAAARLGYRCHIYAPERASVAAELAAEFSCAAYDDEAALESFAHGCDVITYEFENVPVAPLALIAGLAPLRPGAKALEIAQERFAEKRFVAELGGKVAPFGFAGSEEELAAALDKSGFPALIKTNRMGYDGKGQARVSDLAEARAAWRDLGGRPCLAEALVDFTAEFSVLLARAQDGATRFWDCPQNIHEGGILARSLAPANGPIAEQAGEAREIACAVAEKLDFVGVIAVEFFACAGGPLFNEIAPRVHNSGHWTIEGAVTSQFENHIRAIADLPLGDTSLAARRVEMRNLIGGGPEEWHAALAESANHLHLYGKKEARPGRKMGHVTRLYL